jgi:hypothetical protein
MDLCIGVDTGLVHLAASVGVPAVVIVGPTDPNRWSPWRTAAAVLRSSRVSPTWMERTLTALGAADHLAWPLGRADASDIPSEDVEAAVVRLCGERRASTPQTIDLMTGSFRYEVFASSPTKDRAAAVPAT